MSFWNSIVNALSKKPAAPTPVPTAQTKPNVPTPPVQPAPSIPTPMRTNAAGIALIKSSEGLELKAYPDPGTGGDPWTIGYGHAGPEVKKGLTITQAQADQYLVDDLAKFEKAVSGMVKVPLNSNEFSALVSFAYNCGPRNLEGSTLLRKLNAGDREGAAGQFGRWNKAAGKELLGLTKRRKAESELFLSK